MAENPLCGTLTETIGEIGACWQDARPKIIQALELIDEQLGCASDCDSVPCIGKVKEGTPTSLFVAKGFKGKLPDSILCPIVYIIRGCEVWIGVNKVGCGLEDGTGWCVLCSGPFGGVVRAQIVANAGLVQPTANALRNRFVSAIEFNEGISMVLVETGGLGTGYDAFQLLLPGTYVLDIRLNTKSQQTDDQTNIKMPIELWDLTTNTLIKAFPTPEFSGHAPALVPFHHMLRARVTIGGPHTYAMKMNGNPGVGIFSNISLGDEIYIEQVG